MYLGGKIRFSLRIRRLITASSLRFAARRHQRREWRRSPLTHPAYAMHCFQEEQCRRIIDTAVAKYKRVDILVNNAAYQGKQVVSLLPLEATCNDMRLSFCAG